MTIKYIVHTTSSLRDYNGNCYHFARITSTKTNQSLVVIGVGGSSNATGLLFDLKLVQNWEEIYNVETWEKKRDWQRMNKFAAGFDGLDTMEPVYEHQVTAKMIRALNRKTS